MKYGRCLFQTERHSNPIRLISLQEDLLLTYGQWMNSQILYWYNHGTTPHQTSLTVIEVGLCVTLWSKSQLSNTALTQPRNDFTPNIADCNRDKSLDNTPKLKPTFKHCTDTITERLFTNRYWLQSWQAFEWHSEAWPTRKHCYLTCIESIIAKD